MCIINTLHKISRRCFTCWSQGIKPMKARPKQCRDRKKVFFQSTMQFSVRWMLWETVIQPWMKIPPHPRQYVGDGPLLLSATSIIGRHEPKWFLNAIHSEGFHEARWPVDVHDASIGFMGEDSCYIKRKGIYGQSQRNMGLMRPRCCNMMLQW